MAARKAPDTHEKRKALHERLLKFANDAAHDGTTKGLAKLVGNFDDAGFRSHLVYWLGKFTPIRRDKHSPPGYWLFHVPKELKEGYDLGGAKLNPYYTFDTVKPSKPVTEVEAQRLGAGTVQLSDKEFERKSLRLALGKFLAEGSVETRKHLLELITRYESVGIRHGGGAFVQGGAPGLGRKK